MKKISLSIFLLLFTTAVIAQKIVLVQPIAISNAEFKKHLPALSNIRLTTMKLGKNGVMRVKTKARTIILKDDGEFKAYKYEGELKYFPIVVIHEFEPNTEEYYLINKVSGKIDTLLYKPIFYKDNKSFICTEGSGTDVYQRIQIAKIVNNYLKTRYYIRLKDHIPISHVYWYDANTIFIDDNNKSFYKVTLK